MKPARYKRGKGSGEAGQREHPRNFAGDRRVHFDGVIRFADAGNIEQKQPKNRDHQENRDNHPKSRANGFSKDIAGG